MKAPYVVAVKVYLAGSEVVALINKKDIATSNAISREIIIDFHGQELGRFEIEFDVSDMRGFVKKVTTTYAYILFIGFLFIVLFSVFMSNILKKGFRRLIDANNEIKNNGPGYKVYYHKRDEIKDVIDEFNLMSENLLDKYNEIERAREKAEIANNAKDDFLALMSHEIRTPLNGIMGISQIMESELTGEQRKNCNIINKSGEHLIGILNDILDFSKLEQGKLEIESREFSFESVLEIARSFYHAQCLKKGLLFEVVSELPEGVVFIGDELRIKQIFFNLLSNAIKFTSKGTVAIHTSWDSIENEVKLEVSDTGSGIPSNKIKSITQPFVQASNAITRSHGGTGLGLSIVSRLVNLMGGRMDIHSELDVGSKFSVTFPLKVQHKSKGTDLSPIKPRLISELEWKAPKGSRLLIIDDNKINLIVGKKWCEKLGFDVDVASNHVEAMKRIEEHEYYSLLVDHHMPDVSGIELVEKMLNTNPNLIIFGWTADVSSRSKAQFMNAGAKGVALKPLSTDNFNNVVIEYLKRI